MTISKITSGKAAAAATATISGLNTAGSNIFLAVVNYYVLGTAPSFTDSKGNSWTPTTLKTQSVGAHIVYYCINPLTDSSHSFTASGVGSFPSVAVIALSTNAPSIALDVGKIATATQSSGTTINPGSLTPSAANALLVAACESGGTAPTCSLSYTTEESYAYVPGTSFGTGIAWKFDATATARDPQWSWSTNVNGDASATHLVFLEGSYLPWAVNDLLSGEVVAVDNGQTYATISFSGTYDASGTVPVTIEVQIEKNSDGTVYQAYTALSSTIISGGNWSGTLQVPRGDGYRLKARAKDGGSSVIATSSASTNRWGVGYVGAQAGQSHLPRMEDDVGTGGNAPPAANAGGRTFNGTTFSAPVGNGNIALLNGMVAGAAGQGLGGSDIPFCIVRTGIGGAGWGIDGGGTHDGGYYSGYFWTATGSPSYAPCVVFAAKVGPLRNKFNWLFFLGGSSDAALGQSFATLYADMQTTRGNINTIIGLSSAQLPVFVAVNAQDAASGDTDVNWQKCKDADTKFVINETNCFYAGNCYDLTLLDEYHLIPTAYGHLGSRVAQSVLKWLGFVSSDGGSLIIASGLRFKGSANIILTLTGAALAQLNKANGSTTGTSLTGFEVSSDGFTTPLTISATAFVQPNKVVLTLSAAPADGDSVVTRYQYGKAASITTPVYDSIQPGGDTLYRSLLPTNSQSGNIAITAVAGGGAPHIYNQLRRQ